jgi:hypothetical protein
MKQGYFGWITTILVLMLPFICLGGWELLQRHRFRRETERLDAALESFRSQAVWSADKGRTLLPAGATPNARSLRLETASDEEWRFQYHRWTLAGVFADSEGRWYPARVDIHLNQERQFLFRSPELVVFWNDREHLPLKALLKESLKEFEFVEGSWGQ